MCPSSLVFREKGALMRRLTLFVCLFVATTSAQTQSSPDVAPFVTVNVPVFALNHVRVVDGTGTAATEDQTVVIANGKIQSSREF